MKRAASLAEDLLHDHWNKISHVTLIPSGGGVFEITFGDELLWSKRATGQFPDTEVIKQKVASA